MAAASIQIAKLERILRMHAIHRNKVVTGIIILITACVITLAASAAASAATKPNKPTGVCDDYGCYSYDPTYGEGYDYGEDEGGYEFADSTCKTKTAGVVRKNFLGWTMWRYSQRVTWCWSGMTITYINRYRYPSEINYLWQWQGHNSSSCNTESCSDLAGNAFAYIATSGTFSYCSLVWTGCFKTILPRVGMQISAGGGYGWFSGT